MPNRQPDHIVHAESPVFSKDRLDPVVVSVLIQTGNQTVPREATIRFRIGAAIGLMVRSVEAVQQASFVWLFPLTFASSAFVPSSSMPGWLQTFVDRQPITQVVDAVRGFLLGQPVGSTGWLAFAWCAGILVVFVPLSVSLYRRTTAR